MANLRKEQPHLWKRILALSVLFVFMGVPLLFAPSERTPNANISILANLLPLNKHAFIFIALGLLLFWSGFKAHKNYKVTRNVLSVTLGYSLAWLLSLVYGALLGHISSFAIVALWGHMTFMVYNTLMDPGFMISDLIREVRKHHDA